MSRIPNQTAHHAGLELGKRVFESLFLLLGELSHGGSGAPAALPGLPKVAIAVQKGTGAKLHGFDLASHARVLRARRKESGLRVAGTCTVRVGIQPPTAVVKAVAQPSETSPSQPPGLRATAAGAGQARLQIPASSGCERGSGPTKHSGTGCKVCEQSHRDQPPIFKNLHPSKNPLTSSTCPAPSSDYVRDAQLE